jgi:acetolactate synthase-1/2/3 large subunit
MDRNGADIIMQVLERRGVRVVAGMPGGANLPIYDALTRSRIRHVLVRHEQAAGFIAQGMSRVSGQVGVCFATSGPGATNLVTALADAYMDSIPLLAITGQVSTSLLGTRAFQEVDTLSIVAPIVKHAVMVRDVNELEATLEAAFEIAASGRPGPVLVDVPKDVQLAQCSARAVLQPKAAEARAPLDAALQRRIAELLAVAERPVLYIGGGVAQSGAHERLQALAALQDMPVTCTLMGLGACDPDSPLYLGMLGMHAAPYTNLVLAECDLLFCIGARFDDRATGKLSEFCPKAKVIHVDIDASELGRLRAVELGVACDAAEFLDWLLPLTAARGRPVWQARVAALRQQRPLTAPSHGVFELLDLVAAHLPEDTVVTTDVGQHQMWVAQRMRFRRPRRLLTSGGLGTMGFGLPAAIGAALASGRPTLCISGDGSLLINIQELATLAELNLPVTVLLFDNRHLGLVRQQQTLFYGSRLSASAFERATDFVGVARAFGLAACSLADPSAWSRLPELLAAPGPQLIHVPIDPRAMVLPMVAPGAANQHMIDALAARELAGC